MDVHQLRLACCQHIIDRSPSFQQVKMLRLIFRNEFQCFAVQADGICVGICQTGSFRCLDGIFQAFFLISSFPPVIRQAFKLLGVQLFDRSCNPAVQAGSAQTADVFQDSPRDQRMGK